MLGWADLCEENVAAEARDGLHGAGAPAGGSEKEIGRLAAAVVSAARQSGAGHEPGRTPRAMRRRRDRAGESGDGVSRTTGPAMAAEKKSLTAAERTPYQRAWDGRKRKQVEHERLKFLDASGGTTTLPRRLGRATPGEGSNEAVPKNYGSSPAGVRGSGGGGVETAMRIEGAVDTLVFEAFCAQCLRPGLRDGEVRVLDNLGAHRASRLEEIAHACNARVMWLPPSSPAFSAIEPMGGQVKPYLRQGKARTAAALDRAVAEDLQLVPSSACRGWVTHGGD
jgi:hypothetical protein